MKNLLTLLILIVVFCVGNRGVSAMEPVTDWWDVRSVDTMKYSRDLARAKLNDLSFDSVIETQMKNIAGTGASHVAVGTPYDEEFNPFLRRWVIAARKYGLSVWFRGNWSGWEGWFGYAKISKEEHISKTVDFIAKNRDIFSDGDIFTPCPECENGQIGDPRKTGDVEGHRKFLLEEYEATRKAFWQNHQLVPSNYASMNGDVATLVMDKITTAGMGGIVVVDHYVDTPEKLTEDIVRLADLSGGQVVLGEFGVPIPDIHGETNEDEQSAWIDVALGRLNRLRQLSGVNYWVSTGGSTALWEATGSARKGVKTIKNYYSPQVLTVNIKNEADQKIGLAEVAYHGRIFGTDKQGRVTIPLDPHDKKLNITAKDYRSLDLVIGGNQTVADVVLVKVHENWIFRIQKWLWGLWERKR